MVENPYLAIFIKSDWISRVIDRYNEPLVHSSPSLLSKMLRNLDR